MNFVSIKLVTKLEKFSPEVVRADIFALKAFVNKSLKTLTANPNKCPHHQDKGKGVGGLPVQVGHTHNVCSLGLALSANPNGCSHHQDKGKGVGGLPVQVGCTNNVSSLGLVLSAIPNGCPHHQDKGKGKERLPVQVGRTHNVYSLGLALSTMHHGQSREDTQLSGFKICSVCARTLPHSDFSRKEHHSLLRKCKSCITQLDNSGTKSQVLLRNHRMSNGLVDGILHDVPGKKTQDRAIRCIKDDRTVSQDILTQFLTTFPVKVMRLNNIAALGYNPASFKLCKLMTFIKPTTPTPRDFLNDFLTTIQDPLVSHQKMRRLPSTKPSHSFPVNKFHDSPKIHVDQN